MQTLFDRYADLGNVHLTGETDMYSDTVRMSKYMPKNGDLVRAVYQGVLAGSATTWLLKAYFAGTLIWTSGTGLTSLSGTSKAWQLILDIMRDSATTVRCTGSFIGNALGSVGAVQYTTITSLTEGANQILKITGDSSGGSPADSDIIAKMAKAVRISVRGSWPGF